MFEAIERKKKMKLEHEDKEKERKEKENHTSEEKDEKKVENASDKLDNDENMSEGRWTVCIDDEKYHLGVRNR